MFEAHVWEHTCAYVYVFSCKHQQVSWVPCVHANIYYVCGRVVGMDVGFVKLVYVRHPLWAEKSRREVEVFYIFTGVGWWVCVCGYTRVHTHKLLGYSM